MPHSSNTEMPDSKLELELKERLHTKRLDLLAASFAGACISSGHCYSIDDGSNVFVKTNGSLNARVMFEGEQEALKQIAATKTIRVPTPITVMHNYDGSCKSALVMEFLKLDKLSKESARLLGEDLAKLHDYNKKVIRFNGKAARWVGHKIPSSKQTLEAKAKVDNDSGASNESDEEENQFRKHSIKTKTSTTETTQQAETSEFADRFIPEPNTEAINEFGFDLPTSCGSIPQVNTWTKDWVSFYARNRLDNTIRMILSDHSDRELNEQWSHLQIKVDRFFSDFEHRSSRKGEIIPALLHGDLWSGNAAQSTDEFGLARGVTYDPASFYGHSEYDFGIVRMFGGFPREFEIAYFENLPKMKLFEKRNKLYQLFHHLNHWNHFGSGYRSSSLSIMKDLNCESL